MPFVLMKALHGVRLWNAIPASGDVLNLRDIEQG